MPLTVLLAFFVGFILGWLVIKMIRVPHHLQGVVLGCCSTGSQDFHLHI